MDSDWKARKTWLAHLPKELPEELRTPADIAAFELDSFFTARGISCPYTLALSEELGDAWLLEDSCLTGGPTGILYGAYSLIRCAVAGLPLPVGRQQPYYPLRMLDCWDNMDGTIERGYAGRSLWFEGGSFSYDPARIRQLGRMLASAGINVLCLNNVNVHQPAQQLMGAFLPHLAAFSALLRPFGIRLMVSIDFSSPLSHGLDSADPLDPDVARWWKDQTARVYQAVPDLAGFLVKADSEHQPGPASYGRSHAEGANMLARALAPFGGTLVWRAFVYNCMQDWRDHQTDRPRAAFDLYQPMDGSFDRNVLLQVKNGPYDFQVREPLSPLLLSMKRTPLALEFQLAQEYTGQQVDIYAMPGLFRETLDQMGKDRIRAMAAVSNLGRDASWTGHPFAALNLFSYGMFAWNPDSRPEELVRTWIRCTYSLPEAQEEQLAALLLNSRHVYEQYTAPLGLCWMVNPSRHYGPSPYGYEFQSWGTYNRADRNAVGIDRTPGGTNYTAQYPPELAACYADPAACPEELLLFFHRLPYDYKLRDGRTLIQRIYDDHFEGCEAAEAMRPALAVMALPEPDRAEILERLEFQIANAREWRDVINTFFHRFSGVPDAGGRVIFD